MKLPTNLPSPLSIIERRVDHWQILGGLRPVNIHHGRRGAMVYINGAEKGRRFFSVVEAISAAVELALGIGTACIGAKRESKKHAAERRRLFAKAPHCHWCERGFGSPDESTLDHIIPLSRGGSNRRDNLALACAECNRRRGNSLAALEGK